MITVNDKLKLFTKRVVTTREHAYDLKVQALEEQMASEFLERKTLLINDRDRYETTLLKGIKAERHQRLSNARSEKKRRLLMKRKNMIETLLEGVKSYTETFVKSDAYEAYLEKLFKDHLEEIEHLGSFDIYLNAYDYTHHQVMLERVIQSLNLHCIAFQIYDEAMIGGFILLKYNGTRRLDLSLDSVIEDNRTYMGQLIYNILEEAGEFSGKQS